VNIEANGCCVLNGGSGSWAFEPLAEQLSAALDVTVSAEPRRFNYLLYLDSVPDHFPHRVFIPLSSIRIASDKRLMAEAFHRNDVPTPRTVLLDSFSDVRQFITQHTEVNWCLKFPTGCGANGHRMITAESPEAPNWPRPFIVQEFIRLERPEVYRIYCAGGELFGWVTRRFPAGHQSSPWVAHARGARYVRLQDPPEAALVAARGALLATGLYETFGCVDLLCRPSGEWVVLEVGTDGLFNHVDRELDNSELEAELLRRISRAFWREANK
jgi:glutathione synthase/RimK-type ligase-like ATP-grasp enzyme